MRSLTRKTVFAVASLVATAGIVASADPASAATTDGARYVAVRFDAHAAATPAGRSALDRAIRMAAARVCDTNRGGIDFEASRCRTQAVARAEARLDERLAMTVAPTEIASR